MELYKTNDTLGLPIATYETFARKLVGVRYSDIIKQGRTSGVTAESTVLASHQVPYSDGGYKIGCPSCTYAPQSYIIYSNPTTRIFSEKADIPQQTDVQRHVGTHDTSKQE